MESTDEVCEPLPDPECASVVAMEANHEMDIIVANEDGAGAGAGAGAAAAAAAAAKEATTTVKSKPSLSAATSTTTCHVLPCNVEFQGMGNTHVYFSPTPIEDKNCYAATFRGRGLLAVANESFVQNANADGQRKDKRIVGTVLSISEGDERREVEIKATFENILEWRHEHNPNGLHFEVQQGTELPQTNRVDMAVEWSQIAAALHEPLEVN